MGTYTYRCPECEAKKIVSHKLAETPYVRCNQCTAVMIRAITPNKKDNNDRNKNTRP